MSDLRQTGQRPLRRDEIELWQKVLQDVKPLPGISPLPAPPTPVPLKPVPPAPLPAASDSPQQPKRGLLPLAPIERRLRQKLSRGRMDVDASLDLHGLRQDEAHARLRHFLYTARDNGARLVLIVTGKGRSSVPDLSLPGQIGILRRNVPDWLRAPDLRPLVLAVEEATASHGGAGALYVRLRRLDRNP